MASSDTNKNRFLIPEAGSQTPHCSTLIVRKSRFLAQSCHCSSATQARDFVTIIRGLHPDATHNCWAFAAGPPGCTASIGSSDDGEPHGTAGKPILEALLHSDIGQICMVISRWFGGIKLGTGGLARAYQQCALENIDTLPTLENIDWETCGIIVEYAFTDTLFRLLPKFEAKVDKTEYGENATFSILAPRENLENLRKQVLKITNGSAKFVDFETDNPQI